jgi:hypothetical protein
MIGVATSLAVNSHASGTELGVTRGLHFAMRQGCAGLRRGVPGHRPAKPWPGHPADLPAPKTAVRDPGKAADSDRCGLPILRETP